MKKKTINSLIFLFIIICPKISSNGEIKIVGLFGNLQEIHPGEKIVIYSKDRIIPYDKLQFPWELTFQSRPYNNPAEIYTGSFVKYSGETINYSVGVKAFSQEDLSDQDISFSIMTMDPNEETKTTLQYLSSQKNYTFILNFENDDLIAEEIS